MGESYLGKKKRAMGGRVRESGGRVSCVRPASWVGVDECQVMAAVNRREAQNMHACIHATYYVPCYSSCVCVSERANSNRRPTTKSAILNAAVATPCQINNTTEPTADTCF